MGVFLAQVDTREQVLVQARPRYAPPAHRPLRLRCAVHPPGGRHCRRGLRRPHGYPLLRHVANDSHRLLHPSQHQGTRRSLRAVVPQPPSPPVYDEQLGLPHHPPPTLRCQA